MEFEGANEVVAEIEKKIMAFVPYRSTSCWNEVYNGEE